MRLSDLIISANRNLMRNKARTILTVIAIFVGCFAIISTTAIQAGTNEFIDGQMSSFGGDGFIQIMSKEDSPVTVSTGMSSSEPVEYDPNKSDGYVALTAISEEKIEKVKEIEGINADSVMTSDFAEPTYVESTANGKKFTISTQIFPTDSVELDLLAGRTPDNRSSSYEVALPDSWVEPLGYSSNEEALGKILTFVHVDPYTQEEKKFEAEIVGIQAPSVITDVPTINSGLNKAIYEENMKYAPESVKNTVYILAATYDYKNYDAEDIKKALEELGLVGYTTEDIANTIKSVFDSIATIVRVFGAIALIAAAIGIANTLLMSVQERTREIGLDKALGMSSFKVFLEFAFEAALLGFWGSVFGTIVSMVIGNGMNSALHASGGALEALPTFTLFVYTIENIVAVIVIIMVIAFLAGTAPAIKAAKKNPIDALRYE